MTNPNTLAAAITAAAIAMAEGRPSDEIAMLGTVFTQLGDTLATISAAMDSVKIKDGGQESNRQASPHL